METLLKEQILKAFKEGKTIQSRNGNEWKDFIPQNQVDKPNLDYGGIDNWRIKPETIKSDDTETLANALHQIEKLEADKAELLERIEIYKECFELYIDPRVWDEANEFLYTERSGIAKDLSRKEK